MSPSSRNAEDKAFSVSPAGERFPLPRPDEYAAEYERIAALVKEQRARGREIVVVMGVGFVGAVMAAVCADAVDAKATLGPDASIGIMDPAFSYRIGV